MKQISRRAFLRGAGASAAIVAPLSPGLVAWFAREFTPRKFFSFAGKEAPKPGIRVYDADNVTIQLGPFVLDSKTKGQFERIELSVFAAPPFMRKLGES